MGINRCGDELVQLDVNKKKRKTRSTVQQIQYKHDAVEMSASTIISVIYTDFKFECSKYSMVN